MLARRATPIYLVEDIDDARMQYVALGFVPRETNDEGCVGVSADGARLAGRERLGLDRDAELERVDRHGRQRPRPLQRRAVSLAGRGHRGGAEADREPGLPRPHAHRAGQGPYALILPMRPSRRALRRVECQSSHLPGALGECPTTVRLP